MGPSPIRATTALLAALALAAGCSPEDGPGGDADGDGVTTAEGDCDDFEASVSPRVAEGCDGLDNDCDGEVDEGFDADRDGVATCFGDCDDADPAVYAGAVETCDHADEDCDGEVDEDPGLDVDGDGACAGEGDCDDALAGVHPGAAEACDGVDQDCDGEVDEGFDQDGDGHTSCGGDCDDHRADVAPGGVEACDGVDQDCDGEADEGFDQDGDGYTTCGGDCDDGRADVAPGGVEVCDGADGDCDGIPDDVPDGDGDGTGPCEGDCDDGDPGIGPHALDVADGTDEDCDGRVDAFPRAGPISLSTFPAARLGGPGDRLGASLASGALTGDSLPDLVVGAPGGAGAAPEAGRAERVPGVAGGPFTLDLMADALLLGAAGDEAGASVAVGDFDGDGQPDVAVGAPGAAGGLGRIYLVTGAFGAGDVPLASALAIDGTSAGSAFGAALGAGDLDGDGIDDLVVGAPGEGAGAAYVFLGGAWGGISDDSQADVTLLGSPSDGAGVGGAVAVVPDVDGDGVADLLVGSPGYGAGDGRVALFLGRSAASWALTLMEDANTVFVTTGEHEELGARVGGLGDVDGDGRGEIWMGAPGAVSGSGRVSVFRGAAGGFGALRDSADADLSFVGIPGSAASVLVVAGDLDGDGTPDAAVGAPGDGLTPGAVYVVPGPLHALAGEVLLGTGAVAFVGEHPGDRAGEHLAAPGDLSGDGRADLVIAAPGWDDGGPDSGAVFVLLGI